MNKKKNNSLAGGAVTDAALLQHSLAAGCRLRGDAPLPLYLFMRFQRRLIPPLVFR